MGLISCLVDSREPDWVRGLTFGGVPTMVMQLDAGDLLALCDDANTIIVERKEVSDFLNTLRDNRLFGQIARLRDVTPWAYLVIAGGLTPGPHGKALLNYRESGWEWSAIQGALTTVQELGVYVQQVPSDHDYEQAIIRLAGRNRQTVQVAPARDSSITGVGEQILASLPGIGAERAALLMKYCGTAAWALEFLCRDKWHLPDDTKAPPGIGPRMKYTVRQALGLQELEALAVVMETTDQVVKGEV